MMDFRLLIFSFNFLIILITLLILFNFLNVLTTLIMLPSCSTNLSLSTISNIFNCFSSLSSCCFTSFHMFKSFILGGLPLSFTSILLNFLVLVKMIRIIPLLSPFSKMLFNLKVIFPSWMREVTR
mmetsp:Transcript_11951/g.1796  ORF Transcript_11951/g.1796 Transcript_11951/m.1796 type:complete len:125 (-) Transcript_11951:177-551(-)